MKTEYTFVEFEHTHARNPQTEEESKIIENAITNLLNDCKFIVSTFGTMYITEETELGMGHRGPTIKSKSGLDFTWWYNIHGGYKLTPPIKRKTTEALYST